MCPRVMLGKMFTLLAKGVLSLLDLIRKIRTGPCAFANKRVIPVPVFSFLASLPKMKKAIGIAGPPIPGSKLVLGGIMLQSVTLLENLNRFQVGSMAKRFLVLGTWAELPPRRPSPITMIFGLVLPWVARLVIAFAVCWTMSQFIGALFQMISCKKSFAVLALSKLLLNQILLLRQLKLVQKMYKFNFIKAGAH